MTDQEILEACMCLKTKDDIRTAIEWIFQKYNSTKDYARKFRVHGVLSGISTSMPYVLGQVVLDGISVHETDLAMLRVLLEWSKHVNDYYTLVDARQKADYNYAITSTERKLKEFKHTMTSALSNAYHNKPTGE